MEQQVVEKLGRMDLGDRGPTVEKGLLELPTKLMKEMADVLHHDRRETRDKRQNVEAKKGLLDLPLDLMHEVFGPLDARSLLETAKSHPILHKHVMNLPTKRWEIVHLSKEVAIIDYDVFDRQEAEVLLRNVEADFRDQGLAVDEDPLILPELPPNILGSIMSHLDENSLLEVARSHQNLLEATRLMKNKSFYCVDWQREKVTFTHREAPSLLRMPWSWTFDEADVLLMGAKVRWMAHDLGARPPNAVGLRVQLLTFCGRDEDARNAAKLAKALDPCEVTIPSRADAHFLTDRMLRYLRNSRHLRNAHLGYIRVDELKHMLEWRIGGLDAILCDPDGRIPTELLTVVQEMHNQWKSGRRALRQVRIEFPYPLPLDPRIAATCLGPNFPLKHDDGRAWSAVIKRDDQKTLKIAFSDKFLQIVVY